MRKRIIRSRLDQLSDRLFGKCVAVESKRGHHDRPLSPPVRSGRLPQTLPPILLVPGLPSSGRQAHYTPKSRRSLILDHEPRACVE